VSASSRPRLTGGLNWWVRQGWALPSYSRRADWMTAPGTLPTCELGARRSAHQGKADVGGCRSDDHLWPGAGLL